MKLMGAFEKRYHERVCSIHPQGWVPIETVLGGKPTFRRYTVAFTPKGGCPLKPIGGDDHPLAAEGSIHPQGWVPIETTASELIAARY